MFKFYTELAGDQKGLFWSAVIIIGVLILSVLLLVK